MSEESRRASALDSRLGCALGSKSGGVHLPAFEHLRDRLPHGLERIRLRNESGRAELEAMADHRPVVVAGHDDDGRRGPFRAQEQEARETANARHRKVEQHEIDVRRRLERSSHAVEIMRDLDLGARRGGERRLPQPADHQGVIVRNQNPHGFASHCFLRRPIRWLNDHRPTARHCHALVTRAPAFHSLSVPAGNRPIWRSASVMAMVAATPTLSERSGGRMGMRRRASASPSTFSGTPTDSRPTRMTSPG